MNFLSGLSHWFGNLFHPQPQAPSPRPQIPVRMQLPPQAQAPQPSYDLGHFLAQHLGQAGNAIAHGIFGAHPDVAIQQAKQDFKAAPVLGNAIKFAQLPQQQRTVGNFVKGITGAGIQGAGYVAPELRLLKAGEAAPLLAKVGSKFVNQAVPASGFSVAGDLVGGNRNPGQIAQNALFNAGAAGAANAVPTLVKPLLRGPGGKIVEAVPAKATSAEIKALPAGAPTAKVPGLPARTTVPYPSNRTPGGGVLVNSEAPAAQVATEATAPAAKTNLNEQLTKATKLNTTGAVASPAEHIQTLNNIIEHPEASPATKAWAMGQREALLGHPVEAAPAAAQVKAAVAPTAKVPAAAPAEAVQAAPQPAAPVSAPEALANPTTGATDTNQTADRVLNDPNVPQASKDAITNLTHAVHNDKVMVNAADNLVKTDPQTAQRVFESEQLMSSGNLDSHIHLGNSLVNEYNRVGNTAEAGKVYDQLISATTRYGQGLRAVQAISKVSPQGIVQYARNIASKNGKTVTPALEKELVDTAKTVAKMPAGPEKAAALKEMIKAAKQPTIWDKVGSFVGHVTSIPRALMATGDLSFAGRQGEVLGSRFPKEWASANAKAAQWMFSPSKFEAGMAHLANLTDKNGEVLAPTFKAMGLDMPAVTGKGEEQFSSQVLEGKVAKKLGVGHVVAGSDRAFSGAASKLRADVAKKIIDGYGGVKGTANWSDKQLKDMGRVINTMSGRGQGSKYNPAGRTFEKWAPTLSDTLFSARLWKSRLDMLNPVFYATLAPEARKVALQSAGSFATVVSATLAAAAAVGANVETDPRSSDFGKIKVGNTRYDIMGGLQQNIVLAARELTGAKKNSAGVVQPFDGGYGHPNRLSILQDFLTNKETPVLSTISHLLTGKDIGGNPINPWTAIAQNFIPLGAQDVYGAAQDTGDTNPVTAGIKGLAKAAPTFAGIGVQTYGPSGGTATASGAGSGGSNSILSGDNTTPAYKNAQKLKTANNKAAVAAGTRLGGTTELDNAQQRIDAAQKNFPNGLPKQAKDILTRYATLNANGKAAFNADPANKYQLAQAQYAQDKLAGKLTPTQDFQRQQALGKEAVTSKYSPQAQALYSMGKAERNAFLAANPDYAQYMGEAAAMDQELASKGWVARAKLSTGGSSASAKKYASLSAKIAHPTPKFKTISVKKFSVKRARIKA